MVSLPGNSPADQHGESSGIDRAEFIFPRHRSTRSYSGFSSKVFTVSPTDGDPVLMVTHQVTISAITGMGVSSGAAVAYDLVSDQAQRVKLPTD